MIVGDKEFVLHQQEGIDIAPLISHQMSLS